MRIQNLSKTSDKTEYRHFVFLIFEAYLLKRIAYCEKIAVCPQQSDVRPIRRRLPLLKRPGATVVWVKTRNLVLNLVCVSI